MGVETELLGIKNRYDGKEFRVIEREDGTIAVLAGDTVIVDSGVTPVTATTSAQGVGKDFAGVAKIQGATGRVRTQSPTRRGTMVLVPGSMQGLTLSAGSAAPTIKGRSLLRPEANAGLAVTTPEGAYAELRHTLPAPVACPRTVAVELECDDWTAVSAVSLYIAETSGYATGYQVPLLSTTQARPTNWAVPMKKQRIVYADVTEHTVLGTPTIGTTMIGYQKIRITPVAGRSARVVVRGISYDVGAARGSLSIIADDGPRNWYDTALPILEQYGIPSALAFIGRVYGADPANWMGAAEWQDAIARGHEAVVHGCISEVDNLSVLATEEAVYADLAASHDAMIAAGLARNGSDRIYVLPQGIYYHGWTGSTVDLKIRNALQRAGYLAVRHISNVWAKKFLPWADALNGDLYSWPIIGHGYSSTDEAANIAAIKALIDDAEATRMAVTLMFHLTTTGTPSSSIYISEPALADLMSYAAAKRNAGTLDILRPTEQLADVLDYGSAY